MGCNGIQRCGFCSKSLRCSDIQKCEKFLDHIQEVSKRDCWPDDPKFMIYDYCGGNIDDAYEGGKETGEILFARYLLALIGEQNAG